jgi:hypothetical protein
MQSDELKAIIAKIGINQAEFARLVGVTPRAVTLWMVGDRAIPGPVEAYAKLLSTIPPSSLQVELGRLKQGGTSMRDGMYSIEFRGNQGGGIGGLIVDNGRAWGADALGNRLDGDYVYNETTKLADLHIKVTYRPNSPSIFGINHPYEWSIDVEGEFDPRQDMGRIRLKTTLGRAVDATYRYLRALPDA